MGFLKNIIRRGISEGITKSISDAVGKAVENIVAPKAEAYANKAADQLDEAVKSVDAAASSVNAAAEQAVSAAGGTSNPENAVNRWAQAAGRYAAAMEKAYGETSETMEQALVRWNDKLPGFPVWCLGGTERSIDENGREDDGTVSVGMYRTKNKKDTEPEI